MDSRKVSCEAKTKYSIGNENRNTDVPVHIKATSPWRLLLTRTLTYPCCSLPTFGSNMAVTIYVSAPSSQVLVNGWATGTSDPSFLL